MFSLKYKTKGGKYPNRKPRVFFCCYPEDFSFFEHISEQVLTEADCSVWYLESEPETEEEKQMLFWDLMEMQLFVAPVTSVFLREHSYARQELIPFLLEKNIPFLPLMQEAGLDDIFTKTFGDIQYLYEFDQSQAALPFTTKLRNYLQTVLMSVSTEDIEKAFRARIFMSYRKKDRNDARNLMKMIHAQRKLEDVAIWYDEYLVPGENFNDSIAGMIDACDLFLMAVTPNLVKERNYIEMKEYPCAVEAAKPILPCEVRRTSRAELEKRYQGIPTCVGEKEIGSHLENLFEDYPSVFHSAPKSQYHIGCAYLLGIEVEADREHGIRLIKQAAEEKCKEAMHFLYLAYRYGNGVKQDLNKAFAWQKRFVQQCGELAEKAPDSMAVREFIAQSIDLGTVLQEAGKYEEGIAVYEKAKTYVSKYKQCLNPYEITFLEVNLSIKTASLLYTLGHWKQSMRCCEEIIHFIDHLPKEQKDYRIVRVGMQAYEKLGTICFIRKNFLSALVYYQNCCQIAGDSFECLEKEKLILHSSGDIQEITGRIGGDIRMMSMDDMDYIMVQCHKDYAVACTKVGDTYLETGNVEEAIRLYRLAETILNHLIEVKMNVIPVQRERGLLHRKMADAYSDRKEYQTALKEMLTACKMGEEILAANDAVFYQWDIAVYYNQTGFLYYMNGQKQDARMYFEKALAVVNGLNPTPQVKSLKQSICEGIRRCKRRFF